LRILKTSGDELTNDVDVAMKAAMYFWEINNINASADRGLSMCETFRVSAQINNPSLRNNCNNPDNWQRLNRLVNDAQNRHNLTNNFFNCIL